MKDPISTTPRRRRASRVAAVMQREMICSEHGALCYVEAERRERAQAKERATASPYDVSGAAAKEYPGE